MSGLYKNTINPNYIKSKILKFIYNIYKNTNTLHKMETHKINDFVTMLLMFSLPGTLENLMETSSSYGNMGLHGVYRDIYIKRNVLYTSPIVIVVSYHYGYTLLGLLLYLSFYSSFIYTCYKWKDIVMYNTIYNRTQ